MYERLRMQFRVQSTVLNDTPLYNTPRHGAYNAVSETNTNTLNQSIECILLANKNTQPENSSSARQVTDEVPFYVSQQFRDDLSNFSGAIDKCCGEYKAGNS